MGHPLVVNHLEQDDALQLPNRLRLRELRFLAFIQLHRFFLQLLLQAVLLRLVHPLLRNRRQRNDREQQGVEFCKVPLIHIRIFADHHIHRVVHDVRNHLIDYIPHALAVQHTPPLRIDDLTLFVHYLVIFQKVLSDAEVIAFNLLLGRFDGIAEHLMLDLLILRHTHGVEHIDQPFRTEQSHQIVFQGNIELGFARISLTSASAAQLVVNTPGFMPLRADDFEAARRFCFIVQLDIRTTACHVGGNRHRSVHAGIRHDLRLQFMEFGVQHFMRDAFFPEKAAEFFGSFDCDRTYQHRLFLCMGFLHRFHDGMQLLLARFIYRILMIDSSDRLVGGDLHHVHSVDITEFLLFRQGCTRHAGLFLEFIEKVLESDGGERPALPLHLNMFFRLNRLMQAIRISASRHDTAREFIHDQDLIVLHHIVLITEHQIIGPQGQNNIMLNLQVLRIRQVFNLEKALHLGHALSGQVDHLILLVHDKVAGLFLLHAHDRIQLGQVFHIRAPLHLLGQDIAGLIELRGFSALPGDDQRGSRFIDQHRVHLVDDGVMQITQNQLLLVDDHIVSQVVKAQFIIRHISDILGIFRTPFLGFHAVEHAAHFQPQELMYRPHPGSVTAGQVIIDGNNMHTLAFQRVQVCRKRGNQRLTFTCLHLGNTSLMQNNTAHQLYAEGFHVQHPSGRLTDYSIGLRKQIIQRLALRKAILELLRLASKRLIRKLHHLGPQGFDSVHQRFDPLQLPFTVRPKNLLNYIHFLFAPIIMSACALSQSPQTYCFSYQQARTTVYFSRNDPVIQPFRPRSFSL